MVGNNIFIKCSYTKISFKVHMRDFDSDDYSNILSAVSQYQIGWIILRALIMDDVSYYEEVRRIDCEQARVHYW